MVSKRSHAATSPQHHGQGHSQSLGHAPTHCWHSLGNSGTKSTLESVQFRLFSSFQLCDKNKSKTTPTLALCQIQSRGERGVLRGGGGLWSRLEAWVPLPFCQAPGNLNKRNKGFEGPCQALLKSDGIRRKMKLPRAWPSIYYPWQPPQHNAITFISRLKKENTGQWLDLISLIGLQSLGPK